MKLTFFFVSFAVVTCFGQLQNRFWYFGDNVGLDFGSSLNNPQPIAGIGNIQGEGVASISDQSGNFLFYTDGNKILKGLNNPVTATLFGNGSSTQSSIIIPAPNSCDSFYIFTVGACYGANDSTGLQFVKLNRNNWSVSKSTVLSTKCCEKVAALPRTNIKNSKEYWIISVIPDTKDVLIYLLSVTGISLHSKITISNLKNNFQRGRFGYIKPSLDGTMIAIATGVEGNVQGNSWVDLLQFDPANGNTISLINTFEIFKNGTQTDSIIGAYGVEFSSNNNNLFISGLGWSGQKTGYLYCFSTKSPFNLLSYTTISQGTSPYVVGALQLGPDGRIYLAQDGSKNLGVITNPNNANFSFANDFIQNGINFNCSSCSVKLGLPNLLPRFNVCTPVSFCCPSLANLIVNGGFESGNTGFSSQYLYFNKPIGTIPPSMLEPGKYSILDKNSAAKECPNWSVDDHTSPCDGSGNFLAVNGETTQLANSNNVIWQQTVSGLQKDSTYRFCAYMKNLPACCFDIKSKIKIEASPTVSSPWIAISALGKGCDWQLVEYKFKAPAVSITLKILLEETTKGDGNDLAIDDISLHKLPKPKVNLSIAQDNTNQVSASINSFGTNDDEKPSVECKYAWFVAEVTGKDNSKTPPMITGVTNQKIETSPNWQLSTTFPGYVFGNKEYVVVLQIHGCDCLSDGHALRTISLAQGIKKLEVKNYQIGRELQNSILNQITNSIVKQGN